MTMWEPIHPGIDLDALARQALALAERGVTAPNPMVGALLVGPGGAVLGRGLHRAAGHPHAEVEALRDAAAAGRDVRGATMVVSLEPCAHHGRTPPCTEAILAAGIAHVHVALRDPNPIAAGGVERLRQAGVRVTFAGEAVQAAAERQNEVFLHWVRTRRPFVLGRWVTCVDAAGSARPGDTSALRGHTARAHAARVSARAAAIVVDATAASAPVALLEEGAPVDARRPALVLVDADRSLAPDAPVLRYAEAGRVLVVTSDAAADARREALRARRVEVLGVPDDADGRIAFQVLLDALAARELTSVLVEGSAARSGALRGGHVQRVMAYVVPEPGAVPDAAAEALWRRAEPEAAGAELAEVALTKLDPEVFMTALVHGPQRSDPSGSR